MKDIKFRAWDKKEKKMIEVQEMYFNWKEEWVVVEGYIDLQDFELMQYTGLKDRNGTPVYEGDILRAIHRNTGEVLMYEVKYDEEYAGYHPFIECDYGATAYYSYPLEVIGNIYEHSHLLNK